MTDSRRKGKARENELAQALRPVFPDARRNLDQTRESTGRDFDGTAPLCIQLKSGKAPSWRKALEEAQRSAQLGEAALGVTRQDREGFVVHLRLEDFLALIRRDTEARPDVPGEAHDLVGVDTSDAPAGHSNGDLFGTPFESGVEDLRGEGVEGGLTVEGDADPISLSDPDIGVKAVHEGEFTTRQERLLTAMADHRRSRR